MNANAAELFGRNDTADDTGIAYSQRRFTIEGLMRSVRNFATLSEGLRFLGASVLVASMSVFLLQGWSDGNDIGRYLLLLAQSGLLAVTGLAMSHGLKEPRGARVFFGVALISIPANFVILSALLYSVFQWDGGVATTYPDYALWQIDNIAGTGLVVGGALLVLLPVTMFAFAVMARRSAAPLTMHFMLLNALLLVPIRASMPAGIIALAGIGYALFATRRLLAGDASLRTGEGRFALATLLIPPGIVLFRSMYFYHIDALMVAMLATALFLTARQVSLLPDRSARVALLLEILSVPIAFVGALAMTDVIDGALARGLAGPAFALLFAMPCVDLLRRTESRALAGFVTGTVGVITGLSFLWSAWAYPSAMSAILCLAAGGLLLTAGLALQERVATICGTATMMGGLVFGLEDLARLVIESGWIELALFGAGAIVLGSVIDRHGIAIKLALVKWFDAIGERRERIALED